jgi:diguanylate cyclase (GGDEF)-like protein/PAS domain S-box-containing protein
LALQPLGLRLAGIAALAALYGAGLSAVLIFGQADGVSVVVRPMNALAIGALALMGRSVAWPEIAALVAISALCQIALGTEASQAVVLAAAAGAHISFAGWLLRRAGLTPNAPARPRSVVNLLVVAVIAPIPGALIAGLTSVDAPSELAVQAAVRWLLQAVSFLILTPPFLFWRNRAYREAAVDFRRRTFGEASRSARIAEIAVASAALLAAGVTVPMTGQIVLIELSATVLLWFALRFGMFITSLAAAIFAVCVVGAALIGFWPGSDEAARAAILLPLQATLALTTLPALLVASIMSQREHARRMLHADATRLAYALQGANDGIWDWDVPSGASFFSERAARMFGYEPAEFTRAVSSWEALLHPDDAGPARAAFEAHMRGDTPFYEAEIRCRSRDGAWIWVHDRGKVVERDSDGRALRAVGTYTDISERKRLEGALEHLATHDSLTGLANRGVFERGLHRAAARLERFGGRVAVLLIDVDHFKSVNDTYGHAAGDILLATVAGRLRDATRTDDLVARLGGDEFAIIASGQSAAEFDVLAARLIDCLAEPITLDDRTLTQTVSVGIAVASTGAHVGEDLVARADRALYAAKHAGRGTWRFFGGGAGKVVNSG